MYGLYFLFKSIMIGFLVAVPVGPVGLLCIQNTLYKSRRHGLFFGLGAASADAIFGCIAGVGLTFVANFILEQTVLLKMLGGILLWGIGVKTFLSRPPRKHLKASKGSILKAYVSSFLLTITNPATILAFMGIFTVSFGNEDIPGNYILAAILFAGIFIGSTLWWVSLSGGVGLFRKKFTQTHISRLNRISGSLISIMGLLVLGSVGL